MSTRNVTLKEIAEIAGTSVSTVHRVLNNKEGVGEELKEKILKISQELGYTVNFAASTLKKKKVKFAAVLPEHDKNSKYYTKYIEDGYNKAKEELVPFNVECEEYYSSLEEESQFELLNKLFQNEAQNINGLVITPIKSMKIIHILTRFIDRGVPVVLMDRDLPGLERISCVKPDNEMAGAMAGELLGRYIHQPGKVIIADGDVTLKDFEIEVDYKNSSTFEKVIHEINPLLVVERVHETSIEDQLYHIMMGKLTTEKDIVGIYATTARNTVQISRALTELGLGKKVQFIGSEIFDDNAEMLKEGIIDTIIYKNPYKLGYEALLTLFNHSIKGETQKNEYWIKPKIILKNSISFLME